MKSTRILALVLVVVMSLSVLASCDWFKKDEKPTSVTYNTTTSVMPSNWNELNYSDANDTQILSYIGSSFFTYDYKFEDDQKFNADGSINKEGVVPGAYTVNYSAATGIEDVTATVDAKWGYTEEQKAEGGYAWKITLRDDLKWDDGTAITAADFVYSMKEQLNPKLMNFRANTYYDTLMLKGSRDYFYQGAPIYADVYNWETGELASEGPYYVNFSAGWSGNTQYSVDYLVANGYINDTPAVEDDPATPDVDESSPAVLPVTYYNELSELANEYGYIPVEGNEEKLSVLLNAFMACFGVDAAGAVEYYPTFYLYFTETYGAAVDWETVGIYEVEGENAFVICLDKAYSFLTDSDNDGEKDDLALWAAYYMSGLPLVKKSLYEECKVEPVEGAFLWTTTYNTSLETTASWGPYKLVEFEAGSHYKLVKNEHWYGWNLPENAGQYKVEIIHCRKVADSKTAWMGFLNGLYDDAALTTDNIDEYYDSKFVSYSRSTGTFGMQLYSNLSVLKASENNNGILAIKEFRQALNLSLNRSEVVEKIWPGTTVPCFGLVNTEYFYDVENSSTLADGGRYRNTVEAKSGILRAYGWTQAADGTWSAGDLTGLSLDDAYDSLTGYNPTLAKEKLQAAIPELTTNTEKYGYDSSKKITLVYGSSVDNDKQRFRCEYLQGVINELTKGTALEGQIVLKFDASAGSKWSDAFRSGATQIGFGYGFQGNPFDPFNIVGSFVDPDDDLNYHAYWDSSAVNMTLTMPAGDYAGAGEEITMSLQNWYFCINGLAEEKDAPVVYNWGAGYAPAHARLAVLSALEEVVIDESRSVMLIGDAGGSFLGAKFSQFSDEYNTFMGFGGMRYLEVNYNDGEWTDFLDDHNNDLTEFYKQSE
ncbi:MAG: hypothetical protein IJW61_01730 [Clostridia bacterium]|nr:hypothetical protein [Clostridia bacterium]